MISGSESEANIKVDIPGKNAKEIIARDTEYIATSTKCSPIVAAYGRGAVIEDVDGNILLDFASGIGTLNVGHCHPRIVDVVKKQTEKLMHFAGTDFYYKIQVDLAEKLCEITPGNFAKKVFYTNSGAESVEAAIKIAKWQRQKHQFISFIGAFHGRTMGALSFTASKPVHKERFFPTMPGVTHIPYAYCYRCPYHLSYPECDIWCAKILEEVYFERFLPASDVAALFIEPVQGEGGYIVPPKEFVQEIKKITEKYGIIFVDDEVQAGFGRTGKMFGIEHFNVIPDIITVAKALGAGLPIGAAIFNAKLDFGVEGAHSNTFGGNLVACAAALENINIIQEEKLVERSAKLGEILKKRLLELQDKYDKIGDVRGLGLMQATEFVKDRETKEYAVKVRNKIVENAYKRGLILLPCGKSGIRYIPPLIITEEQLNSGIDVLDESIKEALK
jgi:4-aminobutyrate aminotransferase